MSNEGYILLLQLALQVVGAEVIIHLVKADHTRISFPRILGVMTTLWLIFYAGRLVGK